MLVRPTQLAQAVGQWHINSQQVARRNALAASAALAERRRQLDEVEWFLAARALTPATRPERVSAATHSSPNKANRDA